ncbi:T9SS type A sorting domain-containing protein [Flavobacteriales bacterium]|nr:T9SS type A sorting domain-containing protein [Flavobacteriales bacterium]
MKTFYKKELKTVMAIFAVAFGLLFTNTAQAQIFIDPIECDSYIAPYGDTLTATGIYTGTLGTTVWTVNLTIINSSSSTQVISACDSYTAADGTVYTADTTGATATVLNAVGCDSVITYNIDISTGITNVPGGIAVSSCDSYTAPSGAVYTASGAFLDTVAGVDGCPVVTTYNLTITGNTNTGGANITSCGPYLAASGNSYDSTGIYLDTTSQVASGCDSVVTINLTVNSGDTYTSSTEAVDACDSYTLPGIGTTYTIGANPNGVTHIDTVVTVGGAANGCDAVNYNTFTLAWNGVATSSDTSVTSCGSLTWGDSTWTASGIYSYPAGSNEVGCDSSLNINLTIEEYADGGCSEADSSAANGNNVTIDFGGNCGSFLNWQSCGPVTTISGAVVDSAVLATNPYSINNQGMNPNQAGYIDTVVDAAGCKTLYDYYIKISDATNPDVFVTSSGACDSYTDENGVVYDANGLYSYVRANASNGCDETVNLTVSGLLSSSTGSVDVNACNDFTWNGVTYDSTGTYTQTFGNAAGCDSVHTLNLTIGSTSTSMFMSLAPCDAYTMQNGTIVTSAGVYTDVWVAANGCDSAIVLTVTMQSSSTGAATYLGCSDYTYGDSTYTASATVLDTLVAANGCDSVVTVTIDINSATSANTNNVTACNSYTAGDGTIYTTSQTFTDMATNMYGCDSITLVTLTITNTQASMTVVECGSEYYTPSGDTLTADGVYMDTLAMVGACDSIFTINLTFGTNTSEEDSLSCENAVNWNGVTYTTDGTYTWTGTNAAGCDSTATLNLTFGTPSAPQTVMVTSEGPWTDYDGNIQDVSGVYEYFYTNASGCDSVVTVALTVNEIVGVNETLSNVNVYPNPTNGNVTIELGGLTDISIKVTNLIGEVIYEDHKISNSTYNLYIEEAAGLYFVEISNENNKEVVKLLVE